MQRVTWTVHFQVLFCVVSYFKLLLFFNCSICLALLINVTLDIYFHNWSGSVVVYLVDCHGVLESLLFI